MGCAALRPPVDALVEKESPDVIVSDYASGAPFEISKEKNIPLVLNYPLPGTLAPCYHHGCLLEVLILSPHVSTGGQHNNI